MDKDLNQIKAWYECEYCNEVHQGRDLDKDIKLAMDRLFFCEV